MAAQPIQRFVEEDGVAPAAVTPGRCCHNDNPSNLMVIGVLVTAGCIIFQIFLWFFIKSSFAPGGAKVIGFTFIF
jgi:hypothetical protein